MAGGVRAGEPRRRVVDALLVDPCLRPVPRGVGVATTMHFKSPAHENTIYCIIVVHEPSDGFCPAVQAILLPVTMA